MLTQGASSIKTCTARLAMKSTSPQILGSRDSESVADTETPPAHNHHPQTQPNSSVFGDGSSVDASSLEQGNFVPQNKEHPLRDGYGNLSSLPDCNPTYVEEEGKQVFEGEECAFAMEVKHDDSIEREEGALGMQVKHDDACDIACGEQQKQECETTCVVDDNTTSTVHADVNSCSSQVDKLSVKEAQALQEGELNEGIQSVAPHTQMVSNGLNEDVSNLSNEKGIEEQSPVTPPPRKPAVWRTPEPKGRVVVPETEFVMEASSWPTLAEARNAKPSEARRSPSPVSSPAEKVPSSQEKSMEAPKQSNTNPTQPGSKYRSSYKKSSVPSYGKPSFPATENIPVPPMGIHVPNANMFNRDQSMKGNGIAGMNNLFPGPHQAPANGPFYHHRGEGLAPFPRNSMPPYGRGHHGRGYNDANYKHSGFVPTYDQQHIGPRHMHPPVAPFMNINAAQYNYPNFQSDMSYMPAAFTPGYNFATPYFRPTAPPGGTMQAYDLPTLLVMLQRQIEYYFSKENLIRDIFLTSKMDEEGFVPVSLIANFPRVRNLTSNSMLILEALKNSSIVEVKNGKLRSHEWRRRLSGTSQTHGIDSLSNTGVDHAREQGTGRSEEFGEGGFSSLPESKLIAASCAAPWTGLSANLGAINVPAVTSIDSR